jgi:hypothetical protein
MAAGMYAILLFGMRQFGDTIKGVRSNTEQTGGTFSTINMFMKEMTKLWLGMAAAAETGGNAATNSAKKMVLSIGEARTTLKAMRHTRGFSAFGDKGALGKLDEWKKAGTITGEIHKQLRKETFKSMGTQEMLRYKFEQVRNRIVGVGSSAKGAFGRMKSGVGRIPGAMKTGVSAFGKMTTAIASMVIMAAALEPLMKALEPVIEALSSVISMVLEPIEPLLEAFGAFIENNPLLIVGILGVAVAMSALSAASLPIAAIFGAILAILFILNKVFEHFGITLFGSGVHQALVMVTQATKFLLFPLYIAYKLVTDFTGTLKRFTNLLGSAVNLLRGLGAWIMNIIPQPLLDLAQAILQHLPNPLEILRGFLDILSGIFDILTGNWKEGIAKIVGAVKNILLELAKIPFMMIKIGWELIKFLWEGIKKGAKYLYEKIFGGSLVWDIVGWFAVLPLKLLSIGVKMIIGLLTGIKNKITELLGEEGISGLVGKILGFFISIPIKLLQIGKDFIIFLISGFMSMWENLFGGGGLSKVVTEILKFFFAIPIKLLQAGKDFIIWLLMGIMGMWDDLFGNTGIGKLISAIGHAFINLASKAWQWGIDFIKAFLDGIVSVAGSIADVIDEHVIGNIKNLLGFSLPKEGALREVPKWGEHMAQSFMGGISSGFSIGEMTRNLGTMGGQLQSMPIGGGGGNIEINNSFTIHAQVRDQQDLVNLRDEISTKQIEQARRMRVLTGGL